MKILNGIIAIILIINIHSLNAQDSTSQKEVNILFVGSKMTYNNNMLQTLQDMLDSDGLNIKIDSSVYKDFSLFKHLEKMHISNDLEHMEIRDKYDYSEKTATELKLAEKKWDVVILEPLWKNILIDEARKFLTSKSIQKIKKLVDNPNCKFIIYGTTIPLVEYVVIGGHYGNTLDESLEPKKIYKAKGIGRYPKTMKTYNSKLIALKNDNNIELINIGNMVYQAMEVEKKLDYFEEYEPAFYQKVYPSKKGAYFNACVFHKLLTSKNVTRLNYKGSLKKSSVKKINKIVEKTIASTVYN